MMTLQSRSIIILLFLLTISNLIESSKPTPKDGSRPKPKCLKNITSTEISNQPKCIALSYPFSCLDTRLPYNSTTLPEYLPDLSFRSVEEIQNYLQGWQGVKKLPRCWPLIQKALCSLLMPQCEEDYQTGKATRIHLPNQDICNDLGGNECNFIRRQFGWPALFNCSDTNLYARNCTSDFLNSNVKHRPICQYPLVPSNNNDTWFKDIGSCSINCRFPILSTEDQYILNLLIKTVSFFGISFTLFAIVLFYANQTDSKMSRMAKVIRHCNWCQFWFYLGWSLQINNNDLACSSGGSVLYSAPVEMNLCFISFVLTYLSSLASLFWSAHLGRLCQEKLGGQKTPDNNNKLDKSLSLWNYGGPSALLITVVVVSLSSRSSYIDGNGLYGICTVGEKSPMIKVVFVFAPLVIGTLYGNYYFLKIIYKLSVTKSERASLRRNLIRLSALAIITILHAVSTIGRYLYELANREKWIESIDEFMKCSLNINNDQDNRPECVIDSKPIVQLYYLEVLATLATGFIIASWACCESNFIGLRRKLIDLLEDEEEGQRRAGGLRNRNKHDLIDITSLTQLGAKMFELAIGANKNLDNETPSSLASTNLPDGVSGDDTSVGNFSLPRYRNGGFNTSREVINDCRLKNLISLNDKRQRIIELLQQIPPDLTVCPDDKREDLYHGIVCEIEESESE